MRIALFGAGGMIGRRILEEALRRGHEVTAVVRDPTRFSGAADRVAVVQGDVVDAASVAAAVRGHDAVISAVGPAHTPDARPQMLGDAARALIAGMPRASVRRLLVVGGAGSLEVRPGVQLVDTPEFPAAWRPVALAPRDALALYPAARPALLRCRDIETAGSTGSHTRTRPTRSASGQRTVRVAPAGCHTPSSSRRNSASGAGPRARSSARTADTVSTYPTTLAKVHSA